MKYGSVCSGIEAATMGWHSLGWKPVFFSENEAFPCATLAQYLGHGWAYRVLDAQYFGLAQRQKRVFVVGSTRGWAAAAAVLFERASLQGNPPPCRQARESIAASLTSGSHPGSNAPGRRREDDVNLVANALTERPDRGGGNSEGQRLVAHPLLAKANSSHDESMETYVTHALRADGFDASEDGTGRGTPLVVGMTLNAKGGMGRLDYESETLVVADE